MPRGVILKSPIDTIDQGQAYGDAYKRGNTFFTLREREQKLFWDACDKQYEADLAAHEAEVAARAKALKRAKELED